MGLHRCYWLLCLDYSCNLFSFVKVCSPTVYIRNSKMGFENPEQRELNTHKKKVR